MKRSATLLLLLPLFYFGDEKLILNSPEGMDGNVVVSPKDHASESIEFHPPFPGGISGSSLLNMLVAYWNLDETSGARAKTDGSCVSCNLTAVNAPLAVSGAGAYAEANVDTKLLYATHPDLGRDNTSFSAVYWAKPTLINSYNFLGGADSGAIGTQDWTVFYANAAGNPNIGCYDSVTHGIVLTTGGSGNITVNVPIMVTAIYDHSTKKCTMYRNTTGGTWSTALPNGINGSGVLFIGARRNPSDASAWTGTIGPVMYWGGRVLSAQDVADLYNLGKGYSCSSLPAALRTSLVACWNLSEASGTRVESGVGSCGPACDLTAVNNPGRTTGLVQNSMGMSPQFISTSSQALTLADNADLSSGDFSFTGCGWANAASTGGTIFGKYNTPGSKEWMVYESTSAWYTAWSTDGLNYADQVSGGSTTANGWDFVCGWHNNLEGKWYSKVNGNDAVGKEGSDSTDTNAAWTIGAGDSNFSGAIDAVGYWARLLTASELSGLYAAGAGVEYPWSSILALFQPTTLWSERPIRDRQLAIYNRYGVYIPASLFPSRKVYLQ